MRDIQFTEVGMKNFGPYIDPMILEFANDSLTLMTGPNGIGKTMALDAIPFTLYGVTSKGARGDDVVNNVIGKNCHTWVKLTIDNDSYIINRYHKYTRFGNTVTIIKNDGDPYKKGQKEVLPEVERLLCPKKSFMNTLMFGQKIKDFFTDLVDSDKKEIFRKILNLERYVTFYKKADEFLKSLKDHLNDFQNKATVNKELIINIEVQIDILKQAKKTFYQDRENDIKEIQKDIEDVTRIMDQWDRQLAEFKEEDYDLSKIQAEISALESKEEKVHDDRQGKYNELDNKKDLKVSELQKSAIESKQANNEKWHKSLEEKRGYFGEIFKQIEGETNRFIDEKSKIDLELNSHESEIIHLEDDQAQFRQGLEESFCPTCLQKIGDECQKNLNDQIESLSREIHRRTKIVSELQIKRKVIFKKLEDLGDQRIEAERVLKEDEVDNKIFLRTETKEVEKKLEETLEQVQKLYNEHRALIEHEDVRELEAICSKKDLLNEKLKEQEKVAEKVNGIKETIESLRRSRIQHELNLQKREAEEYDEAQLNSYLSKQRELYIEKGDIQDELEVIAEEIEMTEFWKSAFSSSGIPSMLIDEAVPFMNQRVGVYLDKLTNGRYIVAFDTLAETKGGDFRDKISVNVLDTHTRASSRIQLSGGQTRIIDIATILTLGDLQSNIQHVTFNILLFDEIFDSLDEENIGFVSKVLSNMKLGKSIYLISHRHEDQLEADEVLVLN